MNSSKPTLLILAGGMGSRYGKLKQMDSFGPNGETIIDYSIYDAINAGFGKVVFVVRDSFRKEMEDYFQDKLSGKVEVAFVSQELNILPKGLEPQLDRVKPWGTAHAIWVAHDVINEPFGVINADDYYGIDSYKQLYSFLNNTQSDNEYSVIAYYLKNTLSDYGTVNRGVCYNDKDGYLDSVVERIKISKQENGLVSYPTVEGVDYLDQNSLVSMNMWGFLPNYFEYFNDQFPEFFQNNYSNNTAEFYIPTIVDKLIKDKEIRVKVIETDSEWFGVTYQEDKPFVINKIKELIESGKYPSKLW